VTFGTDLKRARVRRKLSQRDLAELLQERVGGTLHSVHMIVRRLECGEAGCIKGPIVGFHLADILGLDPIDAGYAALHGNSWEKRELFGGEERARQSVADRLKRERAAGRFSGELARGPGLAKVTPADDGKGAADGC
jgi:transcriptional regulator with XRE-family HTH domain